MTNFRLTPWNRGISNEKLLDDLRRVAILLNQKTVRYEEYPAHGRCSSRLFATRFGSWNNALSAAGLEISHRQDITEEELYENLEKVWTLLGRQPRRDDMKKPFSKFSARTYEKRFGGWRIALEKFVAYANSEEELEPGLEKPVVTSGRVRFPDLRMKWKVFNRDSFRCRCCGRSPALEHGVVLHVDHVTPWSKGGLTILENLQILCDKCNLGKSDLNIDKANIIS